MKVRSDYVIISAENILRVFTCNELHGFRTPPSPDGVLFSAPLHVVDSELQRVPVKTDACIVAVVADTHGFCNFLLRQTAIERQKIIFQPERPHTQCIRWVLLQHGDEPCYRHIITTCRTRRQDAIGDVVPAPVIALRYGFQQGL